MSEPNKPNKPNNPKEPVISSIGHSIFRRFYYWRMRKFIRMSNRNRNNPDQEKGFGIIRNLASKRDSELMIAPLTNKFYIRNADIFVIVDNDTISIINGVYHYDIPIEHDLYTKIKSFLNKVIERRRAEMESVIRSKIDRSLDNIYYETKNIKSKK